MTKGIVITIVAIFAVAALVILGMAWMGARATTGKESKLTNAIAWAISKVSGIFTKKTTPAVVAP